MAVKRTSIPAHRTNFYVGRTGFLQFIVIHDGETNEGSTPAEGMGSWFAQDHGAGQRSSAHRGADTDSICTYVQDKDTAFGAPGVNSTGWHLEHAGRASQTASQWDDADSRLILANGALAAAEASVRLAPLTVDKKPIPAAWLTDAQLRAAQTDARIKGFITHRQVTRVLKNGSHTDPGANFPAPHYMELVRSHLSTGDDLFMDAADRKALIDDITDAVWAKVLPVIDNPKGQAASTQLAKAHIYAYRGLGLTRTVADPEKFAAALLPSLVAALPQGAVTDQQLRDALRDVLGSLNDTQEN